MVERQHGFLLRFVPVDRWVELLELYSKKIKKDPYSFALYGGEDFEIVFTINKDKVKKLRNLPVTKVGEILPKEKGLWLVNKSKITKLGKGYDHFR